MHEKNTKFTFLLLLLVTLVLECRSQLVPFVNCTVNDGTTCTTVWGYSNAYPFTVVLPLSKNKFSPAPVYRGQPTIFQASTTVYGAFNTTRSCSSGNLTWSLTDPNTNVVRSATTTIIPSNDCNVTPVVLNCTTSETSIADRLQSCQSNCGSACSFCGQVYAYCRDSGALTANFTLDSCMINALGFSLVAQGCAYLNSVDACCHGVTPPSVVPLEPPSAVPVKPPVPEGCSSDAECECGYCCQKSIPPRCELCPNVCQGLNDCSAFIPRVYCTEIRRCTSNPACEAVPPIVAPVKLM